MAFRVRKVMIAGGEYGRVWYDRRWKWILPDGAGVRTAKTRERIVREISGRYMVKAEEVELV